MPTSFDVPTALDLLSWRMIAEKITAPSPEIRAEIVKAHAALTQLQEIWAKLEEHAKNDLLLQEILNQQICWD